MIIDANVGYGGPASYYYDLQSVWVWSGGLAVSTTGIDYGGRINYRAADTRPHYRAQDTRLHYRDRGMLK